MNLSALQNVVDGNIQAIDQCKALLSSLSDEQYQCVPQPYTSSSIGQHIRHVLDTYRALIRGGIEVHAVDYDLRRRGSEVETQRQRAISEFDRLKQSLSTLAALGAEHDLTVKTEVSLLSSASVSVKSNLIREMVFTLSHAVHHFAIIAMIARLQDIAVGHGFGLAPATASFVRENDAFESLLKVELDHPTEKV